MAWNGSDKLAGIIIKSPSIPDMYDHERIAYAAPVMDGMGPMLLAAQKLGKLVDGFIAPTGVCFEPIAVPNGRELFGKRGQDIFTVGMQAHPLCWTDATPVPPTNEVVRTFLDNAGTQYGPRSVLYISFGCDSTSHSLVLH